MSVWDGDEKETTTNVVSTGERERERESNFSGMSHMQRHIGCVRESHREKDKVKDEWRLCVWR